MKVYTVNTAFFCGPLKRRIPAGATIYRYENTAKLMIKDAPDSAGNPSHTLVDDAEYNDPALVTWFWGEESNSSKYTLESTETEDDAGGGIATVVTVGGADTQVLFNDGGVEAGDAALVWDKTNNVLKIKGGVGTFTKDTAGILAGEAGAGGTLSADAKGATAFGTATGGTLSASGIGSFATGNADGTGASITASGKGSFAFGSTDYYDGEILASGIGSFAGGEAYGYGNGYYIKATGKGSFAMGGGPFPKILASGNGSMAFGWGNTIKATGTGSIQFFGGSNSTDYSLQVGNYVRLERNQGKIFAANGGGTKTLASAGILWGNAGDGGTLAAYGDGATAFGSAVYGTIEATDFGCFSGGMANGISGYLATISSGTNGSNFRGAFAFGRVGARSTISATGTGSTAFGKAYGAVGAGSTITASGHGAFAIGDAEIDSGILASGNGSFAVGYATGAGSTLTASGKGSFAFGSAEYGSDILASGVGSFAGGDGYLLGASYYIRATGRGSFAMGAGYWASVLASGNGSMAFGYCTAGGNIKATANGAIQFGEGTNSTANSVQIGAYIRLEATLGKIFSVAGGGTVTLDSAGIIWGSSSDGGTISSHGDGATAFGSAVYGTVEAVEQSCFAGGMASGISGNLGTISAGYLGTGKKGAFAFGVARKLCVVSATGTGAAAFGYAGDFATASSSTVTASGDGAFATGNALAGADVLASGAGSFAAGYATGAGSTITASGKGSTVGGYAKAGGDILSSGKGSFAVGYASSSITAGADNTAQFGPGSTYEANTLSVGTQMRLKGTTGAPGTPRNGDCWVASNYVYIRSNGVSVKIT